MKNKTLIYKIAALVVILSAGTWIYFTGNNDLSNNDMENKTGTVLDTEPEDKISDAEEKEQKVGEEKEENIWVDDNFSIVFPQNWQARPAPMGISAMAVNVNEEATDPEAKKINFKSYIAVTYDTLQDRSQEEYIQYTKDSLMELSPTMNIGETKQISINGENAQVIEAEINQKGIDFRVLIVMTWTKGEDIWNMSFNTTKDKWEEYKPLFYETANSFRIK